MKSQIRVVLSDLPQDVLCHAKNIGLAAVDLETSGLDWRVESVATCQVFVPGVGGVVIRKPADAAPHLCELLTSTSIKKVFHHAVFDLSFILRRWGTTGCNIACTKVASKILTPGKKEHTLKGLLSEHLGVEISKEMQTSNWLADELSQKQLNYALQDVFYLPDLFSTLTQKVHSVDRGDIMRKAFDFLPEYVKYLSMGGSGIFDY